MPASANTTSPHMWVRAWNGERWVSYDAGLGDSMPGTSHSSSAMGPAGLAAVSRMIHELRLRRQAYSTSALAGLALPRAPYADCRPAAVLRSSSEHQRG
jgi:hypothetical protein